MSVDVRSVFIYLAVFGISLFFFMLAERQYARADSMDDSISVEERRSARKFDGHIWVFLAILALCLLAGLRAKTVGADTQGYPVTYMNIASFYDDFFMLLQDPSGIGDEPLHALLVWFCSRFTGITAPLLFFYQLFTVFPVFYSAYILRDKVPITMAMAVYIFFFFNNSLNMMRQSVSCALLLLAFAWVIRDNRLSPKVFILIVVSVLFHRSGLYGAALLGAVTLAGFSGRRWVRYVIYCVVVAFPLFMTQFAGWLVSSGIADSHMSYYLDIFVNGTVDQDWFVNPFGTYSLAYLVMYAALVFCPPFLSSSFFNGRTNSAEVSESSLYSYLRALNVTGFLLYCVLLFTMNTMYGIRFSIFFDFFLIISIPLACKGEGSSLKKLFVIAMLIAIWLVWIIRLGWSASQVYEVFF